MVSEVQYRSVLFNFCRSLYDICSYSSYSLPVYWNSNHWPNNVTFWDSTRASCSELSGESSWLGILSQHTLALPCRKGFSSSSCWRTSSFIINGPSLWDIWLKCSTMLKWMMIALEGACRRVLTRWRWLVTQGQWCGGGLHRHPCQAEAGTHRWGARAQPCWKWCNMSER